MAPLNSICQIISVHFKHVGWSTKFQDIPVYFSIISVYVSTKFQDVPGTVSVWSRSGANVIYAGQQVRQAPDAPAWRKAPVASAGSDFMGNPRDANGAKKIIELNEGDGYQIAI